METLRLVAATELLALTVGIPLALLLFRTDIWGRNALALVMLVSAFIPLPLHATAWLGAGQIIVGMPANMVSVVR